jgi:clan AA aspartic protease
MIAGSVFNRRPTVDISLMTPGGPRVEFEAVVDTGFTGYLTLPQHDVTALALPFVSFYQAQLADGSHIRLNVHEAIILWHGIERIVFVLATGVEPLLGMSLIYGSRLLLEGKDGGTLTLDELCLRARNI